MPLAVLVSSACSTAWLEWSCPTEKLCASTAVTTSWAMLVNTRPTPPAITSVRVGRQLCGRRKRTALTSSSRITVSSASEIPDSTPPPISSAARPLTNFIHGVRGLIAGFATPDSAGVRPSISPTVGAPLIVSVITIALSRYRKPPAKEGTARRFRVAVSFATCSEISPVLGMSTAVYDASMESGGLGDLFGDPDELPRRLAEFAEQMQGNQRLAWADNAIKLAVDMTVAAVNRVNVQGNAEAQAEQIRTVIARVFPEAVALVREAREGLQ